MGYIFGQPNIWYAAHVENDGWQLPVMNGLPAGTTGQTKRLEALFIMAVGADAQHPVGRVTAQMYIPKLGGWQPAVTGLDGDFIMVGTTGRSASVESIILSIEFGHYALTAYLTGVADPISQSSGNGNPIQLGNPDTGRQIEQVEIVLEP